MSNEIKVDHGIKLPLTHAANRKYPWDDLKIGDSFFVGGISQSNVRVPGMMAAARIGNGCKFTARKVTEKGIVGVRVWRVS